MDQARARLKTIQQTLENDAELRAASDLLASAERLLALTGDAVTLCPTYGPDSLHGETS